MEISNIITTFWVNDDGSIFAKTSDMAEKKINIREHVREYLSHLEVTYVRRSKLVSNSGLDIETTRCLLI